MTKSFSPSGWAVPALLALAASLLAGWLDIGANEVQGPALIIMLGAFAVTLLSTAPAWLIALASTAGLPLVHAMSRAAGGNGNPKWSMLVALVPALVAAYGGRGVASLIGRSSADLTGSDRSASPAALLAGALLGCACIGAPPVYATILGRGHPLAAWLTIVWQVITLIAWVVATPLVLRNWQRMRPDDAQGITPVDIATHAGIVLAIAILHGIVLPLATRALLIPLGPMGMRAAMQWAFAVYLPLDALTYCLIVSLGHASDVERRARAAAARESAIHGELALARLASLRAQLRPHFLFNALNAATVLVRRGDSTATERVLTELADLLRYVLRGADDDTAPGHQGEFVTLSSEMAFVESYLAIERERFPDRLTATTEIAPGAHDALIPHLLLQPLVENAIRHGVGARLGACAVAIRARREDDILLVTVDDDGPGPHPGHDARNAGGIGLANSRARLATLYGDNATLSLEPRATGGTVARVELPFRK